MLTWVSPTDGIHPLHLLQGHIGWQTRDGRAHRLGGQLLQQLLALPLPLPGVVHRVLQEHAFVHHSQLVCFESNPQDHPWQLCGHCSSCSSSLCSCCQASAAPAAEG